MFKDSIKNLTGGTIETKVSRLLFKYRTSPHSTTGMTPAELMFGRRLRTHLDLLQPNLEGKVHNKQCTMKNYHDVSKHEQVILIGDQVYVKNFGRGETQLGGVVISKPGPLTLVVELDDGLIIRCHIDHVSHRNHSQTNPVGITPNSEVWVPEVIPQTVVQPEVESKPIDSSETSWEPNENLPPLHKTPYTDKNPEQMPPRRSQRENKAIPPKKLNL